MDLKERLAEVASEVADVRPPAGLWDREVRRRTRARRDTVVVALAAVLAVAALLTGSWHAARQPAPATPTEQTVMPDRIFDVSPWLQGTDGGGELGRLVGIEITDRGGWLHQRPGVVGLSATTGEYRFLDLPDLADPQGNPPAMAPDGRHVAYWTTGATTDTPTERGKPQVAGLAVYDTTTGEVRRAPITTAHGLWAETLFFSDGSTLIADFLQSRGGYDDSENDQSSADHEMAVVWRLDQPSPVETPALAALGWSQPAARAGRFLTGALDGSDGYVLVDLTDGGIAQRGISGPRTDGGSVGLGADDALSEDGRWLATVGGPTLAEKTPNRVTVYDLTPGPDCCGPGRVVKGSSHTWRVIAWLDDDRLLIHQQLDAKSRLESHAAFVAVDVRTGDSRVVTRFPHGGAAGANWLWAVDLLDSPSAAGIEPPHPWDRRVTTAGIALIVGAAFWLIRQRRRRRGGP